MRLSRQHIDGLKFGLVLILLSLLFYVIHFLIFRDLRHIFLYLVGDVAFVFIEALVVTVIIQQVLAQREKRSMLRKLHMVIGAFFSEVGTPLLKHFRRFDREPDKLDRQLALRQDCTQQRFLQMWAALEKHAYNIDSRSGDLGNLQRFLVVERPFLLGLLENPNLLEHEEFTELLWAVFHLAEELSHRGDVGSLPQTDYDHLSGDIKRAYRLLAREWFAHIQHLQKDYPYLFSLAVRINPFDPAASAEVRS